MFIVIMSFFVAQDTCSTSGTWGIHTQPLINTLKYCYSESKRHTTTYLTVEHVFARQYAHFFTDGHVIQANGASIFSSLAQIRCLDCDLLQCLDRSLGSTLIQSVETSFPYVLPSVRQRLAFEPTIESNTACRSRTQESARWQWYKVSIFEYN